MTIKGKALLLRRIEETAQIAKATEPDDLLIGSFPEQIAFITSPARQKLGFCTRRSGKSDGDARMLIRCCLKYPKAVTLFVGLTRDSARGIIWDLLKDLCKHHRIPIRANEARLEIRFRNGSVIQLLGLDASESERRKALGRKLRLVVIDEGQAFDVNLEDLCIGTIMPALSDLAGQLVMTGTPGDLIGTYFASLTRRAGDPQVPGVTNVEGWEIHRWSAVQNPYMRDNWLADIARLKAQKPGIEKTSSFQQNFLGLWVVDDDVRVYKYLLGRNDAVVLPILRTGWHWVLGVDLGFDDASAFVLVCYNDFEKVLYVVEVRKERGLDFTAVSDVIRDYQSRFDIDTIVIDGANKQGVEEMRRRQKLPLEPADKQDKVSFIRLMNDDYVMGRVKLLPEAKPLVDEYASLIWDRRKFPLRVEHAACENHASDGALYAWRFCYPYLSQAPVQPVVHAHGTPAWAKEQEERLLAEAEARYGHEPKEDLGWSDVDPESFQ